MNDSPPDYLECINCNAHYDPFSVYNLPDGWDHCDRCRDYYLLEQQEQHITRNGD